MTLYKYTYYMASNKIDIEKLNVKKRKGKYIMKSNNSADYFYSMGITCVYGLDCKTQLNKLIKDDFYTGTVTLYMFSENSNFALTYLDFAKKVFEYLTEKSDDLFTKKYRLIEKMENWTNHIDEKRFPKGETKICV